VYYY
jgi:hypothetical protein